MLHVPQGDGQHGGGGHGFMFSTDDCRAEVERLRGRGAKITQEPEEVPWGTQAVFEDPFGKSHVLVQPPVEESS